MTRFSVQNVGNHRNKLLLLLSPFCYVFFKNFFPVDFKQNYEKQYKHNRGEKRFRQEIFLTEHGIKQSSKVLRSARLCFLSFGKVIHQLLVRWFRSFRLKANMEWGMTE
jgi:hypothetical protein